MTPGREHPHDQNFLLFYGDRLSCDLLVEQRHELISVMSRQILEFGQNIADFVFRRWHVQSARLQGGTVAGLVLGQRRRFDGVGLFEGWRLAAEDVWASADLAEGTTHD